MISEAAKDLLVRLLDPNPVTRLSLAAAQSHTWLRDPVEVAESSYMDDYNSFLITQNLYLKPKMAGHVDLEVVSKLESMQQIFRFSNLAVPFNQLIGKYLRKSHRSSVKKELGSQDAAVLVNLCVAYKFLFHLKLVQNLPKKLVMMALK